jgi:outer membrane protein TolC
MHNSLKHLYFLWCIVSTGFVQAQQTLSLTDVWKEALVHNHQLRVAAFQVDIAKSAATKGNAGFMPVVGVQGGANYQRNDSRLDFAGNIPSVERNGVQNYALNASINATYRIYGGGISWLNLQTLHNQYKASVNTEQIAIEGTLLQVANLYLNVLISQENEVILKANLLNSKDRLIQAVELQKRGIATSLEVLAARVDVHTDSAALIRAMLNTRTAMRSLQLLTGRPIESTFLANWGVEEELTKDAEYYRTKTMANNTAVAAALLGSLNAEIGLQQSKAQKKPIVDLNLGYGYNRQINEVGILLESRNLGLNGQLTLVWNLFDGNRRNLLIKNAEKQVLANGVLVDLAKKQAERELLDAYDRYETQVQLVRLQEANVEAASGQFTRAMALFESGLINSTTFREAQNNRISAELARLQAKAEKRLAALEVRRLCGELLTTE